MSSTQKVCPDCHQPLEPITFFVHHQMKHELEWLVENRKKIADEPDLDAVLCRLIHLEVDKRLRIEQQKEEKKGTRIQRR